MCLLVAWIKAPLSPCVDVGPWVIFSNRRIFLFFFSFFFFSLFIFGLEKTWHFSGEEIQIGGCALLVG